MRKLSLIGWTKNEASKSITVRWRILSISKWLKVAVLVLLHVAEVAGASYNLQLDKNTDRCPAQ